MFDFGQLGERSIQDSLKRMVALAAVAGPFQCIGFFIGASLRDDGLASPVLRTAFIALLIVMILRFALWRYADAMTARSGPRAVWRLGFALTSVTIALAWCALALMGHEAFHLDARMSVTILFCSSIAAISTQAFAFEFALSILFQLLILGPPAAVFLAGETHTDRYLGAGMAFYTLFTCYLAFSQSRALRAGLRKNEIIEEQRLKLAKANDEIAAMIDSIEEAFLIFDPRGACVSPSSRISRQLLGQDVTGRRFLELIPLSPADTAAAADWLSLIVEQPARFSVFASLGPKECVIDGRELSLNYNALWGTAGSFDGLVVTVRDVTREREAGRRAQSERHRADLILGAQEHTAKLRTLIEEVDRVADALSSTDGLDLTSSLHTLKGAARVIGAWDLAQIIHDAELAVRGDEPPADAGHQMKQRHRAWLAHERELLVKLGVFDDGVLKVSEPRLLQALHAHKVDAEAFLARLTARDVGEILRGYQAHVRQTGERLNKRVELRVVGQPLDVPRDRFADVFDVLVHVLNNSVDHGIEPPTERTGAGKGEVGVITARYGRADGWLELVIEDDGRGINVERVRRGLIDRGVEGAVGLPTEQVIQHVFDSGLSTAQQVTQLSGLGVGLSAVKRAVEQARGTVVVGSDVAGTRFVIRLPLAA